jgi:hypothetical protein
MQARGRTQYLIKSLMALYIHAQNCLDACDCGSLYWLGRDEQAVQYSVLHGVLPSCVRQ